MRRARRLTALLVSLFFAHVLWVGSGFACAMPSMAGSEHSPGAESPGAEMASMDMPDDMSGMHMPGMEMLGTSQQQSEREPAHHHAPCEFPPAPGDCQSMTPCAPLALASTAESPRVPDTVPSSVALLAELAPPSRVSPPELPPPRA